MESIYNHHHRSRENVPQDYRRTVSARSKRRAEQREQSKVGGQRNKARPTCCEVPLLGGMAMSKEITKEQRLDFLRGEYQRQDERHMKLAEKCDLIAGELANARFERDVCAHMMDDLAQEIAELSCK